MEPRSTNLQQAQDTSQRPDWTSRFPRITPMKSAKSQVWGDILGDFFCTNSDEDLLGAILALSIFRSFQEARLGFLWSFCPGGILATCVSSNCWYELV